MQSQFLGRTLKLAVKSQDYVIEFYIEHECLIHILHVGTK